MGAYHYFRTRHLSSVPMGAAINRASPLARGLKACYIAGVTPRGNTWRDIAGGNHGTLVNADWSPSGLEFNGTTSAVESTSDVFDNLGPVTYSAYVYYQTLGESSQGRLFGKGDFLYGMVGNNTGGNLFFNRYTSGTTHNFTTTVAVNTGQWLHIAVTWNGIVGAGADTHIYFDGVDQAGSQTNGTGTANDDSAQKFQIGNAPAYNRTFDGFFDSALVHNRALSPTEVNALYLESLRGYPALLNRIPQPYGFVVAGGGATPKGVFGLALDGPLRRVVYR